MCLLPKLKRLGFLLPIPIAGWTALGTAAFVARKLFPLNGFQEAAGPLRVQLWSRFALTLSLTATGHRSDR